jgi:hypothetical protein
VRSRPRWSIALVLGMLGMLGIGRLAAADPIPPPRVIHAPVARILPRGQVHGTAGVNRRAGGVLVFTGGLADLAELELGVSDELMTCDPCTDADRKREHVWPLVAGFKLGVNQGTWFRGQPALALGFRTTAGGRQLAWNDRPAKLSTAFLAVGAAVGAGISLHAGASLWASRHRDPDGANVELVASTSTIRPFVAFEYTPTFYPRTTLLADVTFAPELEPRASTLRWVGGWGVRYQALRWGSIELAVRHREGDGLAGSTVMVRLNGAIALQ